MTITNAIKATTKLFRSSGRPIQLEQYLADLNKEYDLIEALPVPVEERQRMLQSAAERLDKLYPNCIEVKANSIRQLRKLINQYGPIISCVEGYDLVLYIAE